MYECPGSPFAGSKLKKAVFTIELDPDEDETEE